MHRVTHGANREIENKPEPSAGSNGTAVLVQTVLTFTGDFSLLVVYL